MYWLHIMMEFFFFLCPSVYYFSNGHVTLSEKNGRSVLLHLEFSWCNAVVLLFA